jgi:hypothetical protein
MWEMISDKISLGLANVKGIIAFVNKYYKWGGCVPSFMEIDKLFLEKTCIVPIGIRIRTLNC